MIALAFHLVQAVRGEYGPHVQAHIVKGSLGYHIHTMNRSNNG